MANLSFIPKLQDTFSVITLAARVSIPVVYFLAQEVWISVRGPERLDAKLLPPS